MNFVEYGMVGHCILLEHSSVIKRVSESTFFEQAKGQ